MLAIEETQKLLGSLKGIQETHTRKSTDYQREHQREFNLSLGRSPENAGSCSIPFVFPENLILE
jgi:hypothetical protein